MGSIHRTAMALIAFSTAAIQPATLAAQTAPTASIAEMATTPLVRVNISESLRTPPDEASITVGTQAKGSTATAAVAANKVKTEKLLAAIRAAGIRERDIQTQGIQLQPDYLGPNFAISDPAPLRKEARIRAMARGQSEATEFARNNGYTSVRLLSVEEGVSYRGTDVVVNGLQVRNMSAPPPPPPPPAPERDGGIVAPGQLEAGVTLNLLYRMER